MAKEIVRELVAGEWVTTVGDSGGGGGGVTEITSTDMSVTITDPSGPTVDLSASGGSSAVEAATVDLSATQIISSAVLALTPAPGADEYLIPVGLSIETANGDEEGSGSFSFGWKDGVASVGTITPSISPDFTYKVFSLLFDSSSLFASLPLGLPLAITYGGGGFTEESGPFTVTTLFRRATVTP